MSILRWSTQLPLWTDKQSPGPPLWGLFAALMLGASQVVLAQADAATETFPAEYFASTQPADAYDMVKRLPGFELVDIDEEVRGFAGSRGNVLIDGTPPSGKQESLEQMLRRIPASAVLRIELLRGGTGTSATAGYDLVANVVRRAGSANSGAVAAGLTGASGIGVRPDARIELSRQTGASHINGSIALETDVDDDSGAGQLTEFDAIGAPVEEVRRDEREVLRRLSANVEHKAPLGSGELVTNLSAARERTSEDIVSLSDERAEASEREETWSGEVGAQFRAPAGKGQIEAVAVARGEWQRTRATEDGEQFAERTRTRETLARIEYRTDSGKLPMFASIEGALNNLAGEAELTSDGILVPLAGSDARVTERRGEAAIGLTWRASKTVTVEPSLRAEYSRIRSSGDSSQDDSFLFWKPRLRISWNHRQSRFHLTIEREAAQLDFEDFVASAELDRDDIVAGARSLRPPTSWSAAVLFEQRFWGEGALILTFRRERIDDVIDHVLVQSGDELFDAVGNIGKGKRTSLRAELTAPLDRLGLEGMEIRTTLIFLKSRVTDPVTGEKRWISEDRPFEGDVRFTHDLPGRRWSWGVDASLAHQEREFRFDELRQERKGTALGAHVEFRPDSRWRVRGEVENLTSRMLVDRRREYGGSRAADLLDSTEVRRIKTSPIYKLSVRHSFGAGSN
jgi:hypothetical protein